MKQFRIAIALFIGIFISVQLNAQEEKTSEAKNEYVGHPFFPTKGDIGLGFSIDGLIDNINLNSRNNEYGENILFGRYYWKNDVVLRLGLGINLDRTKREQADSVGSTWVEKDSTVSQMLINVSLGIEKHLPTTNRLDPYLFSQLDLTFIGKRNTDINVRENTSVGVGRDDRTIKRDGGTAIGWVNGAGFNYFLTKNFSIGTELALQIQFITEGGTVTDNRVITPINGSVTNNFERREDQLNRTQIQVNPNALINVSYFF